MTWHNMVVRNAGVFVVLLTLIACANPEETDPPVRDAGPEPTDAGFRDAGVEADAGDVRDAGPDPRDGGPDPRDGGPDPRDGGPDPRDGGPDPRDGGPDPRDGGPDPRDGGPPPRDGGPPPRDGGPPPRDAGPPDAGFPDAGFPDAGFPDSGVARDGGPTTCIDAVQGSHYLRDDTTVVHHSGVQTVITTAGGAPLTGVTQIYSMWGSGCGLRTDGTVWCWPTSSIGNRSGQLGRGTIVSSTPTTEFFIASPVLVSAGVSLSGVQRIAEGSSREYVQEAGCAVLMNGSLSCWGSNDSSGGGGGSLFNDGVPGNRPFAVPILAAAATPLTGVTNVSLGTRHACLMRTGMAAGEVWCWGGNIGGPLGQGNQTGQTYPVQVTLPGPAAQLGAGADATCARVGTSVYCWGSNNSGQVGIGPPNAPGNHDGCINFCKLTPTQVIDNNGMPLSNVVDYEMHYLASCAKRSDNTMWCWGWLNGAAYANQAFPLTIGAMVPVVDVSLFTSSGSGGIRPGIIHLHNDTTFFRSTQQITPLCP